MKEQMQNHKTEEAGITGDLSPKVVALYDAVASLMSEGVDVSRIKVADITNRAGIGKGTAYEYFHNKEDIICYAVLYHVNRICRQVKERIDETEDFTDSLYFIMERMDREIEGKECFIRFIHMLSDNGGIGRTLRDLAAQKVQELCMPDELIRKIVEAGLKKGTIQNRLPLHYMYMSLTSKILCYILFISGVEENTDFGRDKMREMICEGLLREFN